MKTVSLQAEILGEKYRVSGEAGIVNQALALYREALEQVRGENRGREVSTHRLGVLAGIVLAENIVRARNRGEKNRLALEKARRELDSLIKVCRVGKEK